MKIIGKQVESIRLIELEVLCEWRDDPQVGSVLSQQTVTLNITSSLSHQKNTDVVSVTINT